MRNGEPSEREATVDIDRGLFILRCVSGVASDAPPLAMVRPTPSSEPYIEVISAPGIINGFLSGVGECVVIRAERAGQLSIKLKRANSSASADVSLKNEPISGTGRTTPIDSVSGPSETLSADRAIAGGSAPKFTILAHVSRRGDVEVEAGTWIAGPEAPAAIEGLEIRGSLTSGMRIEVQPLVATNPRRWMDWAPAGAFAGTRGRALPLVGIRVRLVGGQAERFVLAADALFLGSPIVSKRGRDLELVNSAGGDPLVGLRLNIESETTAVVENAAGAANTTAVLQRLEPSRVRVFRAAGNK